MSDYSKELSNLVLSVAESGGSDLHLSVGRHPTLRVSGLLVPLIKKPFLTPDDLEKFVEVLLNEEQKAILQKKGEVDFAYGVPEKEGMRFRCNAFRQRGFWGVAMRLIPAEVRTLEELNLPEILRSFALERQGFFLVVGPTGHGKSTTLASLVDIVNRETSRHVVTIEDPIEYIFTQDKSIIDQREVSHDTADFRTGLRSMFRQDIDVAMVGEMRDSSSISIAVTAAETGHLVLSSLHTNNASQTIDRIIDSFPAEQQNQIRLQLAGSLLGIFSQRLVPRTSGGLIPAYELLIANTAVRNLIREGRTHELDIVMETSSSEGMVDLNRSLLDLVRGGEISMENALAYSQKPRSLMELSK
ncbi:PilT/PilU family type 4a pilus ATPase [Patescibacteria group bacterium]|nr:PilT/PilU family type 4a pilus ATPase [Patescibacteria group bacterium]MBU2633180.1 PilT/PilU family type 4a pilus ATPase [Patescibacteria group bacterium]